MKHVAPSIKIIQITDTHLTNDESLVFGVNTNRTFDTIMDHLHKDLADVHAIFLTGDLSQDETIASYQIIANAFKKMNINIFWIPGNHDSITHMTSVFSKQKNFFRTNKLITPTWDFIFLNTQEHGKDVGLLSDNEYQLLTNELKTIDNKPTAVVMHHHPIPVQTPLIDQYGLQNHKKFLDLSKKYNVQLIICGHVHGDYSLSYGNMLLETSPASCFQFAKGTEQLKIENRIGYKIYYFASNQYVTETRLWKN